MEKTCLQASATLVSKQLKLSASIFCGASLTYYPLLVDEGYLLIDFKGSKSFIYVKKR